MLKDVAEGRTTELHDSKRLQYEQTAYEIQQQQQQQAIHFKGFCSSIRCAIQGAVLSAVLTDAELGQMEDLQLYTAAGIRGKI